MTNVPDLLDALLLPSQDAIRYLGPIVAAKVIFSTVFQQMPSRTVRILKGSKRA